MASLPYKPDFKVMPEGWDGTTRDLDEVHYEISQKEDEMLYQEFLQKMNFNKKKVSSICSLHLPWNKASENIYIYIYMYISFVIVVIRFCALYYWISIS